tara:strand:- start:255 stop:455 length:201 start_codon:yes stop_codon:yes gene_type:complete
MNKEYTDSEVLTILQAILDSACTMAGRQITVFLPTDPDGKLLVNRSVNYYIKEIEITLNKLKREEE